MTEVFHHGARVLLQDSVYRPIETTDTSTIGLVYTAPDADPQKFPLNQPVLFLADRYQAADLGNLGTGRNAIDGIYDHIGVPIVGVRVAETLTIEQQLANIVGDYATRTGVHAFYKARNSVFKIPKILIAPGFTSQRVIDGITQITIGSGGAGYTPDNTRIVINGNGYGGGARARPIIQSGVITGVQIENCGLGYSEDHLTIQIVGDGVNATISGFHLGTAANPVVAELGGIANRLRSTIIADCPNGTAEQSVAYRNDWATERIFCVDNYPLVQRGADITAEPPSARVAGMLAKIDNEEGFWVSPSNQVMQGIVGLSKPIDDSGVGGEADYLNERGVATVLRRSAGFKLWGNRGSSTDPLWRFFAVGRTRDAIFDSIETTIDEFAPGRPLNLAFFEGVADSVNEKLRYWKSRGALVGGKLWVDPALNPPGQLVLGKPKFSMNFEPTGVAEDIQILASREPGYYRELVDQVVLALAQ